MNLYQQEGFNEEKMQSIAKYLNKLTKSQLRPGDSDPNTARSSKNVLNVRKIDLQKEGSEMDEDQLRSYKAKLRRLREQQLKEKARI